MTRCREILNQPSFLRAIKLRLDGVLPIVIEKLALFARAELPEHHLAQLPLYQVEELLVHESATAKIS